MATSRRATAGALFCNAAAAGALAAAAAAHSVAENGVGDTRLGGVRAAAVAVAMAAAAVAGIAVDAVRLGAQRDWLWELLAPHLGALDPWPREAGHPPPLRQSGGPPCSSESVHLRPAQPLPPPFPRMRPHRCPRQMISSLR